jgi:myosin regulatory light chain 12
MSSSKTKEKKTTSKKKDKKEEEPAPASAAEESAPAPAAEEEKKEEKREEPKRAQRATSNVFALFNQSQIQEFKEAFAMIDTNRDGIIDVEDLRSIWTNLGREPDTKVLQEMLAESPGQLNFTHFLTLFGEKMHGTDSESTLRDAFVMFDEDGKGKLNEEYVKDLLTNVGDQFSKDEIKQVWKEAPIEGGMLDYLKFVQIIKRGKEDE